YKVELTIRKFELPLKNGFFAKAKIYTTGFKKYYKVPISALVEGEENSVSVYVQHRDTVRKAVFQPMYIGEDFVVAGTDQLSNSRILTEGAQYLQEGEFFQALNSNNIQ
ncbi:MAG: hypothetical protein AAFO69_15940, partial [Bacteroidota bacterium]